MAGQRIIDPTDPQSIMRMMERIDKLEKKTSSLNAQYLRTKQKVKEIAARKGKGTTNIQFTSTSGTVITYSTGFVIDEDGVSHQILGNTITTSNVAGGTVFYFIYNPVHGQMYTTANDSALIDILKNSGSLHLASISWTGLGLTRPGSIGPAAVYPLGSSFSG